jgi:hypothetical protein
MNSWRLIQTRFATNSPRVSKPSFNFSAASAFRDNCLIFGAEQPGAQVERNAPGCIKMSSITSWSDHMKCFGIKRVLSLLNKEELSYFDSPGYLPSVASTGLIVESVNVFDPGSFGTILNYLNNADAAGDKVVVHCTGGEGRVGVVLATWIMKKYGVDSGTAVDEILRSAETQGVSRKPNRNKVDQFILHGTLGTPERF